MIKRLLGRFNAGIRNVSDNDLVLDGPAKDRLIVKFYFCLLAAAFLVRLGSLILLEFDDMTHAAMGVSILTTGDWFAMHEGVLLTWIKPPLYFWIEAVLFKLFGVSEYWARFPSALAGFLCVVLTYKIVKRLWDDKTAFLTLVVLSFSYFFLKYSRRAMLDVPVAFATTLGLYALVRAEYDEKKSFYLLFGASVALGYYLKGLQGIYLLGIAPAYFLLSGQAKKIFSRCFLGAAALALGLAALWAVPQALKYGREFVTSQSGIGPLASIGGGSGNNHFYEPFMVLLGLYWPWIPFSLYGLWLSLKGLRGTADTRRHALLLAWFAVILLALSVCSAFYLRYLIPLVPPLAIWAASTLARLIKDSDMGYVRFLSAAVFAGLVMFAACTPVSLDRQGTQYISLYRTVNQVAPPYAKLLLYKDRGYRFIQGLVVYSGRTLDKQVMNADALLAEYAADSAERYTIATAQDFKELAASAKMSRVKFDVAASSDNWVLFKLEKK